MSTTNRNQDFRAAQKRKRDEFYTSFRDIELEMQHYEGQFSGKTVYCNCDDPRESNFFRYFADNFEQLGLKRLITTCYRSQNSELFSRYDSNQAVYLDYNASKSKGVCSNFEGLIKPLKGDGDFRSEESIQLLKDSDVIVTNPPFSLLREYIAQLFEYGKQFIILANMNALTYNSIFPYFQSGQMWYGPSIRSGDREFSVPDDYPLDAASCRIDSNGTKYIRVKGVRWFTNMDFPGRYKEMKLEKTFDHIAYPRYANFDAIDVSRTRDIPKDYPGLMGVPITFFDQYSPMQFEIVGSSKTLGAPMAKIAEKGTFVSGGPRFYLSNGDGTFRRMYDRIVIRNRRLA